MAPRPCSCRGPAKPRASANAPASANAAGRRAHLLGTAALVAGWSAKQEPAEALLGTTDGVTIVNSVLAAYGLPKLRNLGGFSTFDDIDYAFAYPRGFVGRANTQRPGVIYSDFNTADKVSVEVFDASSAPPGKPPALDESATSAPLPANELPDESLEAWVMSVVNYVISPSTAAQAGDARLELVPNRKVRVRWIQTDNAKRPYAYLMDFPSDTITRSGYNVRRRNFAIAVPSSEDGGRRTYALIASARSDQMDAKKEQMLRTCVASFEVH